MKNKKKGFTLVELLVVIAILAILATVSILGYTSFTEKAKISVAEQEMAQVRTQLLADWLDGFVGDADIKHATIVFNSETGYTITESTVTDAVDPALPTIEGVASTNLKCDANFGDDLIITEVYLKASNGYYATWNVKNNTITASKTAPSGVTFN